MKVGDKVVYVGVAKGAMVHEDAIVPKQDEIIILKSRCSVFKDNWDLVEYQYGKDGRKQSFPYWSLRPIQDDFAEEVLQKAKPKIIIKVMGKEIKSVNPLTYPFGK